MYIFDKPYRSLILSLILHTLTIGILYRRDIRDRDRDFISLLCVVTCIPMYVHKNLCFLYSH